MILSFLLIGFLLFLWSMFCSIRSVVERSMPKRLEFIADEIVRGAQNHLGTSTAALPISVVEKCRDAKAVLALEKYAQYPALWDLGNAISEECWRNGFLEGRKLGEVPRGKIRLDLTVEELLQMSWLANLGFQHMMPNYRGFEIFRFSGEEDAKANARAVSILECAVPKGKRPFADLTNQMRARDKMISDWWVRADTSIA